MKSSRLAINESAIKKSDQLKTFDTILQNTKYEFIIPLVLELEKNKNFQISKESYALSQSTLNP